MKKIVLMGLLIALLLLVNSLEAQTRKSFKIKSRYLNFPIEESLERQKVILSSEMSEGPANLISLAHDTLDYWVFRDVSAYIGKTISLLFERNVKGIERIFQADTIIGHASMYNEINRPQLHFTTKRGWINDPNGLVWQNGKYHLFYQHNPYETNWQNMHWGHAVSEDLIHWEQLPTAMHPDELGMMFSGSAVIDKKNTAGFGKDALVIVYTAARDSALQCLAYSIDGGQTINKYEKNPVLDLSPDARWARDPKVFWSEAEQHWVIALFQNNSIATYTTKDLKEWKYNGITSGFHECPELFELPVDNNPDNTKWIMYGASGTYMIGEFNGYEFKPETGKYHYAHGDFYAAQTYNNEPNHDQIQMAWANIKHPNMPFRGMMLFPQKLSLRTTSEGLRLFCNPIPEIEKLHVNSFKWDNCNEKELNNKLKLVDSDLLHIKMDVEITKLHSCSLSFGGQTIIDFNGNHNKVNGNPYFGSIKNPSRFKAEIIIDKTSAEIYLDGGKMFISKSINPSDNRSIELSGYRKDVISLNIYSFEIHELISIWD